MRQQSSGVRESIQSHRHVHGRTTITRHLWPRDRQADATATTTYALDFSPSHKPPPPDDALHAVPLRPTTHRYGAHSMVSFPSLHRLKSDPRATGVHLGHFPHPLSLPVTGIGQCRRRPCAMATAPMFPIWAGQFQPIGTVGLFILLWINLNNSK
jgi:hypothetical protein